MSDWSYINGTITVEPAGRTQIEKKYVLDTVLEHLPKVTGSERDMNTYVIQPIGENQFQTHNEFGQCSKDGVKIQNYYIIAVEGRLRDRTLEVTIKDFNKWLCRLAKRVSINNMVVNVKSSGKEYIFTDKNSCYEDMFEMPSWLYMTETAEPAWFEYLLWDRAKDSDLPLELYVKYYSDTKNKDEFNRRLNFSK